MKEPIPYAPTCRRAAASVILPLRTSVLRPHFPPSTLAHFEGDDDPGTFHVAAFWPANDQPVGCATCMRRAFEHHADAFQLRGMAVRPDAQSQGIGSALLRFLLHEARRERASPSVVWCNARLGAVAFYASHGFAIRGEAFDIAGVGPHHVMWTHT